MLIAEFKNKLQSLGALTCHEQIIFRHWLNKKDIKDADTPKKNLPKALKAALPDIAQSLQNLGKITFIEESLDSSKRLLLQLNDQETIESVLLLKDGLCVSSQVGCAVACVFCMTGKSGLVRHLSGMEILAQVALARHLQVVKKVVFMGMGEASHNLDNVLESIEILGKEGNIGHKNLVLSTVGDARLFERLNARVKGQVRPALAVSLHTTDEVLRRKLLPKAPPIPIENMVEQAEIYARKSAYPVQYQWTLLKNVNDSLEEINALASLLKGKHAMVNFILYNPIDLTEKSSFAHFERPEMAQIDQLIRALRSQKIIACLRDSAGQDVKGACGQLRAKNIRLKND